VGINARQKALSSRGSSVLELVMSTLLTGVVLLAGGALFGPAIDVSHMVMQRASMQQSARSAVDVMSRELRLAGNGIPGGGIQLPAGTGSVSSKFACDSGQCYQTNPVTNPDNEYSSARLYALTTGDDKGAVVNGITTDIVTIAYRDPNSNLDEYPLTEVSVSGNQIRFDTSTSPAYDDPVTGVKSGDILLLCNMNGCAAGAVTNVQAVNGYVDLGADPLNMNQSAAAFGNISSLMNPASETRAFRILVVTYYIDASNPDALRLMRQVNAHPSQVAAFNVEDLQMSYDIFDQNSSTVTNDLSDAGGTPNQIRKINMSVGARSPGESLFQRGYERLILTTSVSPRNLRYRDLY
jgi:Tfp pilus assembly protein PilW